MSISLLRDLQSAHSLEDVKTQVNLVVQQLEDYLNTRVDIFLIESQGPRGRKRLPTLKVGDIVFDFTVTPGVATLQQWDGKKFITFSLSAFAGFINLLTQANGSGTNPTLFLRSDGAGMWVLDSPSKVDNAEILANTNIPAFSLVTGNGQIADSSNLAHFGHVIGISTAAVLSGFIDTVVTEGEVTNGLWTWVNNDKIFLNGTSLSTTPPASGFNQFIAIARNNNTIYVRLQQPILL